MISSDKPDEETPVPQPGPEDPIEADDDDVSEDADDLGPTDPANPGKPA